MKIILSINCRILSCISGYMKHVLSNEQKKSDFKIDSDDQVIAGQTPVYFSLNYAGF